ncbi:hypothetical protein HDU67_002459 [Dinochytrium kinnereticum]|nr:hypothetical protein HDU67_002459 [Dinochytrium kinnereticum]
MNRGWIVKNASTSIHDFLERNRPSITTALTSFWISVRDETNRHTRQPSVGLGIPIDEGQEILDKLKEELTQLHDASSAKQQTPSISLKTVAEKPPKKTKNQLQEDATTDLLRLACVFRNLCGKWVLFEDRSHIDAIWAKVAKAVVKGELGESAKVSTVRTLAYPNEMHVICVYVDDFTDVREVRRVFEKLKELGLDTKSFKINYFTQLKLYSGNSYGLSPSLYTATSIMQPETASRMQALRRECLTEE